MIRGPLFEARRAAGLTRKELARKVGVTDTTVGRWERGEFEPRDSVLEKLAEALKLDAAALQRILAASGSPEESATAATELAHHGRQAQRLVEILLDGLASGVAASQAWAEVARAAAMAVGLAWPDSQSRPESTIDGMAGEDV